MRKLFLLALVMALAPPAGAAHRVTVAQLEQTLSASLAAHHADAETALHIGELELSERLTDATLNRFAATLKLEPRTALALQLLADQSAFLAPPAAEQPATAPPDAAEQQRVLDAARGYAVANWGLLPNFFVTRTTTRFDDTPQAIRQGEWPVRLGLHKVGASTRQVTFRAGREVEDAAPGGKPAAKAAEEVGLHSWGEFGPALSVVLADMAGQPVTFSHWEQTPGGFAAVFRYQVPRVASHYGVSYCCVDNPASRVQVGGSRRSQGTSVNVRTVAEAHTFHETPSYHGTIAIDPATGAVLRLTIEANLSNGDPLLRAATVIEYAPVAIGERQFICPMRSLALSVEHASHAGSDNPNWRLSPVQTASSTTLLLNETRFSDYHRLGSTVRILAVTSDAEAAAPAPAANPELPDAMSPPAASNPAPAPSSSPNPDPAEPTPITAAAPLPPAEPVIPEISMTAAAGVPDQPRNDTFSLKVTSRLVDVGLVAYDKKGHPVTDLQAGDLEVYDNGKRQEIRSFGLAESAPESPAAPTPPTPPAEPVEQTFSNRAPEPAPSVSPTPSVSAGSTVLLIDEGHIGWTDMSYARGEVLRFLHSLKPGEHVGLYSMNNLGFRVLTEATTDHAALIARMEKFMPSAQSVAEAQDAETRNRQHFDEVHNVADLNSVNGNHTEVPDADQPIDPQLMTMGDDPTRASFVVLAQVARHLAALPGPKKLVWVSSDNVLADWTDQKVGIEKSPTDMRNSAMRAQEAMNEAHAAVYPFDVSQLESGTITADLQHRNVELTQAAADVASLPGSEPAARNSSAGRISAAMSQDLHPVQGSVRDVAAATGGRVIRRSGDLAGQLNTIVADGHATFLLSFAPAGPADGQYHAITVKPAKRRDLTLRYRTGYIFEKEPATLGERFRQAVWRPRDVSEIALTATASAQGSSVDVTLAISARDLEMEQQAGRWMNKLDIFFIQRDDTGLHAHVEGQTLGLRLRPKTFERLMAGGVPFERVVPLRPQTASLRVVVVDENSGRMGSVTIPQGALHGARP
jgi:VWFA-related protein